MGPAQLDFFETKVRPVLAEHCFECHSARADKLKGGLHLDSRDGLLKGGDSGPAVVPGEPGKSRLIEAVRYGDQDTAMPPKGKLPDGVVKDLEQWVEMGAPWPPEVATPAGERRRRGRTTSGCSGSIGRISRCGRRGAGRARRERGRGTTSTASSSRSWKRTGLKPVADADRATLVRRIYFDLIGLPPTPEQIDAFVNDSSPDAYERLVDQLLASPHFGERWGRHWLDVARYGESLTLRGFVLQGRLAVPRLRDRVVQPATGRSTSSCRSTSPAT